MLLKKANSVMICNVRWCVIKMFDNNPTHVLSFYQSELNR